jgi:hypothetical protein
MKAPRAYATFRTLRQQPLWRLLAADKGPVTLALLASLFPESERVVSSSVLLDRLAGELEELRALGEELPQAARGYIDDWRSQGWLSRTLPAGASEEQYELTADAASAIRYISSLLTPRPRATESRLATIIDRVMRLADETDPDAASRLRALHSERDRIDRECASLVAGNIKTLPEDRALERVQEIVQLTEELSADFRRVRAEFGEINAGLRTRLLDPELQRGDVLAQLFADVDVIADSDAGRSFAAFWALLTDPEKSAALEEALSATLSRPFSKSISRKDRLFLLHMTRSLLREGDGVHDVMRNLARNLKSFVHSREYLENRRMQQLVVEAQRSALALKDAIRPTDKLDYDLSLTSSPIDSISRWELYDPSLRVDSAEMVDGVQEDFDLETFASQVGASEINFRELRLHVALLLDEREQVGIADLIEVFGTRQGLGTLVGYLTLATTIGEISDEHRERVSWTGIDGLQRHAWIPRAFFLRGASDGSRH